MHKENVICASYHTNSAGQAIAGIEPDRELDLFFDWRHDRDSTGAGPTPKPGMENPSKVEHALVEARKFAEKHPSARFAVLRIWSAPHFYPIMLRIWNRHNLSFTDAVGRNWEWKFLPKDMPCSEWSIHEAVRQRIAPYTHKLKDRVHVKRDLVLVMGTDEEDLLKYAVATSFALTSKPWRLELDLWKSFVNVNLGFLESLDDKWLE